MFYKFFKKILFSMDPEKSHELVTNVLKTLEKTWIPDIITDIEKKIFCYESHKLSIKVWDIEFPNCLGLAAGFDKSGELYSLLSNMGFGFIECGTFTPKPQEGNPRPRIFRYPEHKAIVNRMGFNNPGIEGAIKTFSLQKKTIPRGINIGKNKNTPNKNAIDDYIQCFENLYPYADYFVINISSPNTPNLRDLQESRQILELIQYFHKRKKEIQKIIPVLIKISPDLTEKKFYSILDSYLEHNIDGLILTNTTTQRSSGLKSLEIGGLSGKPLQKIATQWIKKAYSYTKGKIPIIGVGGIFNGQDALEKIMAGASLIQIYTGYIYEGPYLPRRILQFIDEFLKKENTSLREVIGIESRKI